MDLRVKPKADLRSRRALGRRLIFCLFLSVALLFVWNLVIAFVITVALRTTEPYAQWDPVTFQEWKVTYEKAVLIVVWPLSIAFLIAHIFFDISSIPLQSQQVQLAVIDRVKETAAASDRNISELTLLDFERKAPRPPVQTVVTRNLPQSPHDIGSNELSWRNWHNDVLNSMNASLSSLEQSPSAAGISSELMLDRSHTSSTCSNASTETHPEVPQRDQRSVPEVPRRQEPSDQLQDTSHNSQGSTPEVPCGPEHSEPLQDTSHNDQESTPEVPCGPEPSEPLQDPSHNDQGSTPEVPRRPEPSEPLQDPSHNDQGSTPEVPRRPEPSEPLQNTNHNSSPYRNASTEQHDQGPIPEANTAPESIIPSGEDTRERLFQEVLSWLWAPNQDRLKEFLHFDSDDPGSPFSIPYPAQLDRERRMLERRSANRKITNTESFRVYGIPELWEHDRLKCWVYLNQFCHGQRWPQGYVPLCTEEELDSHAECDGVDDMTSIWSGAGSDDYQK